MIKKLFYLPILAFLLSATSNSADEILLPEDQAFRFSAVMHSPNLIKAKWEIADGYYMYRNKLDFQFNNQNIKSTTPQFPVSETKQDTLFGEVEVYTSSFSIDIPISMVDSSLFSLIASGQGCNEPIGVCYPPMVREVSFHPEFQYYSDNGLLGSAKEKPLQSVVSGPEYLDTAADLRSLLSRGFSQKEFLDVDDAFKLRLDAISKNSVNAKFEIADGYYLYRDKIVIDDNGSNRISKADLPNGKLKQDVYFGEVEIFERDFAVPIHFTGDLDSMKIHAQYQGCAVDGICYSPVSKSFDLASLELPQSMVSVSGPVNSAKIIESDNLTLPFSLGIESAFGILLGAFIAGMLLTFTPCVLPMVPILSSILAGQGKNLNKTRGGVLSTAYVVGTVVTYAVMGGLAGATGDQLQSYFQNIWAIGLLSGLFFVMAMSMFGVFHLTMPAFIQEKIQGNTRRLSGSIPLVFLLGLFSALIIGACVSPILISFLGVAMTSQNPLLGARIMVAMALGMGIPLIALGIGAGYFIPRAGRWMIKVNQGFGVMLIAVAIYLLGLLPQVPVLLLWGGYFIILSLYLISFAKPISALTHWEKLEKGLGIILLIWGISLLIGGFFGQRDIFRPLPSYIFNANQYSIKPHQNPLFTKVANLAELDQHLEKAREQNRLVMIDYYADWCVDCLRMEETTFADSEIRSLLNSRFIAIQIDVTDPNDPDKKALKQRYSVFGPPATLFIDREGQVMPNRNFYGYMDAENFLALLKGLAY